MTLKELFRSVRFDDILPIIIDYDPQITESRSALKQAFDSIRLTSGSNDKPEEAITVSYFNDIDASDGMSVRNCSNDLFEVVANRQVQTAPNVHLTLNELAAYCLWELTFWGYSDEEVAENFMYKVAGRASEPRNRYEREFIEKSELWFPPINVSPSSVTEYKPQNRAKRQRDYRRERRLKQLLRFAKIEELCDYVAAYHVDGVSRDELWSLKNVVGFTVHTDRSFAEQPELAEQYLVELYDKYSTVDNNIVRSIAMVTGGASVKGGLDALRQTLANRLPDAIIGVGDRSREQITVRIINVLSKTAISK